MRAQTEAPQKKEELSPATTPPEQSTNLTVRSEANSTLLGNIDRLKLSLSVDERAYLRNTDAAGILNAVLMNPRGEKTPQQLLRDFLDNREKIDAHLKNYPPELVAEVAMKHGFGRELGEALPQADVAKKEALAAG